jgi:hypothetical protein
MASLFGARRRRSPEDNGEDSDGSGSEPWRAKRRRLEPEGASPGGWLSTFVSGARRVISTVLFSSSEEQVSEDDEEEEDSSEPSQGLLLLPFPVSICSLATHHLGFRFRSLKKFLLLTSGTGRKVVNAEASSVSRLRILAR